MYRSKIKVPGDAAHAENLNLVALLWKNMSGDPDRCIDLKDIKMQGRGNMEIQTTDSDKDGHISPKKFKDRRSSVSVYNELSVVGSVKPLKALN
jgi:hypothetical protein